MHSIHRQDNVLMSEIKAIAGIEDLILLSLLCCCRQQNILCEETNLHFSLVDHRILARACFSHKHGALGRSDKIAGRRICPSTIFTHQL